MSINVVLIITVAVLFILMFAGTYIHYALFVAGLAGVILMGSASIVPGFVGVIPFPTVASYSLSTIPMFILTAQFILQAGIIEDLYAIIYKVSRGKSGLLGSATIVLGAFLGAVCGSGVATSASLSQVAYPQLVKHGYSEDLAGAVSSAAGSLSGIIPPSIIIIFYGVATETSISALFVAAIIPGILCALVFILCNFALLGFTRRKNPVSSEFVDYKIDKKRSLISLVVGLVIVGVIFGGIFSGLMTPTEAGAVGAFVAFLGAAVLGKMSFKFIKSALFETAKVTSMCMLLCIGAKMFSRFVTLSQFPRKIIEVLTPLLSTPAIVFIILLAFYFILFMFMDGGAVILMTAPILLPLINLMDVDPIWFGIFVCLTCVLGLLTPPVGMCVYTTCAVNGRPVEGTFKYATIMAFCATFLVGGLMIVMPQLTAWLPGLMGRI